MPICSTIKGLGRQLGTTQMTEEDSSLRLWMISREESRYTIVMERNAIVVSSLTMALSTSTMMQTKYLSEYTTMKMTSLSKSSKK